MTYYAERKSVKDGAVQPVVYKTGTQAEMEYQFHLFCASAVKTDVRRDGGAKGRVNSDAHSLPLGSNFYYPFHSQHPHLALRGC